MFNIIQFAFLFCLKLVFVYYIVAIVIYMIRRICGSNKKYIMIVLGSGGHTAELLLMLKKLDLNKFERIIFVYSHNDVSSLKKISETLNITTNQQNKITYQRIYRSRNVGQSFFTSIFTTILAIFHSCYIIFFNRPNLVKLLHYYINYYLDCNKWSWSSITFMLYWLYLQKIINSYGV